MNIRKWHVKAFVQKIISYLPASERINYFFQKHVTKGVILTDEYFKQKLIHANDHLGFYSKHIKFSKTNTILELGTGWYPVVPILFFLHDAGWVLSLDIKPWLTKNHIIKTIDKFIEWKQNEKIVPFLLKDNAEKWQVLNHISKNKDKYSKKEIEQKIGLTSIIQDARKTGLSGNEIDFICSNNTFEHIYKNILIDIIAEFHRILKPGGIMAHFIDLSDHFAHSDQSITIYNFLKYSDKKWNFIDNSVQPQNRLRWPEYIHILTQNNFNIIENNITDSSPHELEKIHIHAQFEHFNKEELAISHGYLVCTTKETSNHDEA